MVVNTNDVPSGMSEGHGPLTREVFKFLPCIEEMRGGCGETSVSGIILSELKLLRMIVEGVVDQCERDPFFVLFFSEGCKAVRLLVLGARSSALVTMEVGKVLSLKNLHIISLPCAHEAKCGIKQFVPFVCLPVCLSVCLQTSVYDRGTTSIKMNVRF